jgi:hypothetical protein
LKNLLDALRPAIAACSEKMTVSEVTFDDEMKKGKEKDDGEDEGSAAEADEG